MMLLTRGAADRLPRTPIIFHSESENEARLMGSLAAQSAVVGDSMAGEKVDKRYRDVAIEGHTAMD